ncbi:hypothetical protein Kpho02_57360 [Kitasatospora phosalacinea]|uniref:Protein kinase domain-containing protein n=1 Tax=Kitasatospora phosalacinea TaxID=2065 RepID=A0A9W6QFA3_9ACTN|nr:serine/threonine-protein kinase [Kitasatospora phosalacinea]GLW73437.1 hypothetical protein Kpho02_57360 [Kitasatospora phosalacinea]
MTAPAPRPLPGPRPGAGAGTGWPARLAAALPPAPDRIVLPHHSPSGDHESYAYPTEDDAVVLLPGLAVVVHLLPASGGRVLGHSAAYHWHHERDAVRTVVPNPFARIRHKQSVLHSRLGRQVETRGVVVHYEDADVTPVRLGARDALVPLGALGRWLAGLVPVRPTPHPREVRHRLNPRLPRTWPENGYRQGRVLTYQDSWVVHEGVHTDPAGHRQRVALLIGPVGAGTARDHDVAHRTSRGPLLAPFTVENGTRLVVPSPLPPGDSLAARLRTGPGTDEALRHSLALLRTLADRHALGVVHQSIRPELVFPDEDGRTVTLVGAVHARIGGRSGGTDLLRTEVHNAHVAPEIRQGRERTVPQAADIWSWASVTTALLRGSDPEEHPPTAPAPLPADLPDRWRRALQRALGDQRQRPTAAALLAALDGGPAAPTAAATPQVPPLPVAPPVPAAPTVSAAAPAPRGARLHQLGPYRTEQERRVAHTLAKGLDPADAVIVAARADRRGRDTDVDCVVLRGDLLIAVECKNWQLPEGLDPAADTWPPGPGVTRAYTTHSPLPLLRQLAPALQRQIGWPGRSACLLVVPRVPALTGPTSDAAATLVSQEPRELLARVRALAPGNDRPPEFEACLRRLVGEIATPEVLSGFRLEALHAIGDGWQAYRAEANGLPYHLKVIGENMTTLPRDEAVRLRGALSERTHTVARTLADRPALAARVFRPVRLPRDTSEVEPHLLIAYAWEHDHPLRRLPAPLPAAGAVGPLTALAAAVTELHGADVVLRHLSPDSAYLCPPPPGAPPGPYVKVSMLEWMRVPGATTAAVSRLFSHDPSPYVAPEIRSGDTRRSRAADLYSLGAVAHWLLTGQDPTHLRAHERAAPLLLEHGAGRGLAALVAAALRPWEARPGWSAAEFARRVAAAVG